MHLQKLRSTFEDQTSVALITAVTVAWSVEKPDDTTDHKQCAWKPWPQTESSKSVYNLGIASISTFLVKRSDSCTLLSAGKDCIDRLDISARDPKIKSEHPPL